LAWRWAARNERTDKLKSINIYEYIAYECMLSHRVSISRRSLVAWKLGWQRYRYRIGCRSQFQAFSSFRLFKLRVAHTFNAPRGKCLLN